MITQINPVVARRVAKILERRNAVLTGSHLVYNAGHHGPEYANKDEVNPDPVEMFELGKAIWELLINRDEIEVVAGPTLGGALLAQWVAYHISLGSSNRRRVHALPCEKKGEGEEQRFEFRPTHVKYVPGKKVAVLDDVVNTGKSFRLVVDAVRALGGTVVAATAAVDRSNSTAADLGVELYVPALRMDLQKFHPGKCPLCIAGTPINVMVGKGKEFVARYGQPPYPRELMQTFQVTG